jgi:outer membrane protein TolC
MFRKHFGPLIVIAALLGGCGSNGDVERDTQRQIDNAVRSEHAITLHQDGEPVDAATTQPARTLLLLSDAVQAALDHDPRLQAALARIRAAEADANQARLLPNPIINFDVKFPEGGGRPKIEGSLAEDLVAVLEMPRRSSAADKRLRAASADALTTALDVVADVQEHYASVQALTAQARLLGGRRQLLERLAKIAQARVSAGEAAAIEATTIEAQQLSLSQEIGQRKADEMDERLVLARLTGQPSCAADWDVSAWTTPATPAGDERRWVVTALTRRPELAAGKWELAALGDDVALASFATFEGTQIGVITERDSQWMTGPSISGPIPLLDWGQVNVRAGDDVDAGIDDIKVPNDRVRLAPGRTLADEARQVAVEHPIDPPHQFSFVVVRRHGATRGKNLKLKPTTTTPKLVDRCAVKRSPGPFLQFRSTDGRIAPTPRDRLAAIATP